MFKNLISLTFSSPFAFIALAVFSMLAIVGALVAQYVFHLAPCPLCIYQRIPYFIAIFLGAAGVYFEKQQQFVFCNITLGVLSLNFLVNTAIAAFHSGVERQWWKGLQGCSAPDMSGSLEDILEQIRNAPIARCDEIPWADPVLGLSMANYNVLICFIVALYCGFMIFKLNKAASK